MTKISYKCRRYLYYKKTNNSLNELAEVKCQFTKKELKISFFNQRMLGFIPSEKIILKWNEIKSIEASRQFAFTWHDIFLESCLLILMFGFEIFFCNGILLLNVGWMVTGVLGIIISFTAFWIHLRSCCWIVLHIMTDHNRDIRLPLENTYKLKNKYLIKYYKSLLNYHFKACALESELKRKKV